MSLWIHRREEHWKLVLSFDFLLSHTGLLFSLLFYYAQVTKSNVCPLMSVNEMVFVEREEERVKGNIWGILGDYVEYRGKDAGKKWVM